MSKKYSYSTKKIITIAEHKIEEKNKPTKKKILVQNFKVPLLLLTMVPLKSKHIIPLLTTSLHCNFCTFPKYCKVITVLQKTFFALKNTFTRSSFSTAA